MLQQHTLQIRVQYYETDGQQRVHHANYLNYFERGRVEMLRVAGLNYKDLEADGLLLVVTEIQVRYHTPAAFDDLLMLTTAVTAIKGVRIWHRYRIERGDDLVVQAESVIACIDRRGRPCRLPVFFQELRRRNDG